MESITFSQLREKNVFHVWDLNCRLIAHLSFVIKWLSSTFTRNDWLICSPTSSEPPIFNNTNVKQQKVYKITYRVPIRCTVCLHPSPLLGAINYHIVVPVSNPSPTATLPVPTSPLKSTNVLLSLLVPDVLLSPTD
jgi:hypothetical protein